MKYKLDAEKLTLNGKPMGLGDLLVLLCKYEGKYGDPIMEKIIQYWVMKYDGGWNGYIIDKDYTIKKDPQITLDGGS